MQCLLKHAIKNKTSFTLKKWQIYAILFQRAELTKSTALRFSLELSFYFSYYHLGIEIPGPLQNGGKMELSIRDTIQSGYVVYDEILMYI